MTLLRAHQCPFAPGCQLTRQHRHPYALGAFGTRRCGCGGRRWQVIASQLIAPEVVCEKCGKRNWLATAWEQGRHEGRKEAARALESQAGPASPAAF